MGHVPILSVVSRRRRFLQQRLQSSQIALDPPGILRKLLRRYARLTKQREHHLAARSVWDDPNGVVDRGARLQDDVVVKHSEAISFYELNFDPAHRTLRDPLTIDVTKRVTEPGCPFREVLDLRCEAVDVRRRAVD